MKKKNCQRGSILSSNRGFSLVELLVVIAIMAVATGIASITYSLVHNANVAAAANELDTAFNKARIQSMAKGPDAGQLTIWVDNGILYYTIGDPDTETPTAVNAAAVEVVSYRYSNGGSTITLTPTLRNMPRCEYRFNSAGMVVQSSGALVDEIVFAHGTRKVAVIFYLETGKHTTELR